MSAFETITYLWLLPAIGTCLLLIRHFVHADGMRLRKLYNWQLNLIITLSVIWPIGIIALVCWAIDNLNRRVK